jgi:hypothetical protein
MFTRKKLFEVQNHIAIEDILSLDLPVKPIGHERQFRDAETQYNPQYPAQPALFGISTNL